MTKTPLDEIMGTEEASHLWNVHQDHIKRLCREGKLIGRLVGKTWVLLKNQDYPYPLKEKQL